MDDDVIHEPPTGLYLAGSKHPLALPRPHAAVSSGQGGRSRRVGTWYTPCNEIGGPGTYEMPPSLERPAAPSGAKRPTAPTSTTCPYVHYVHYLSRPRRLPVSGPPQGPHPTPTPTPHTHTPTPPSGAPSGSRRTHATSGPSSVGWFALMDTCARQRRVGAHTPHPTRCAQGSPDPECSGLLSLYTSRLSAAPVGTLRGWSRGAPPPAPQAQPREPSTGVAPGCILEPEGRHPGPPDRSDWRSR